MSKTLGEQRVRTEFNPSMLAITDQIKQKSAELINLIESMKIAEIQTGAVLNGEQIRLFALAQTAFEEGAMWGVKAATFGL